MIGDTFGIIRTSLGIGLVLAFVTGAFDPNRTEESLRSTGFGRFRPPASVLVVEQFELGSKPSAPFHLGQTRPSKLYRVFATDDPAAFQRAFIQHAAAIDAQLVRSRMSIPLPTVKELELWDRHQFLGFGAVTNDAVASLWFDRLGKGSWKATVQIADGPCVEIGPPGGLLPCEPAR